MAQSSLTANSGSIQVPALKARLQQAWRKASRYWEGGPAHFLMYVFGRFGPVRKFALFLHRFRRVEQIPASAMPALEPVDIGAAAQALESNGIFPGLQLRPDILSGILERCSQAPCYADEALTEPFAFGEREAAEQRYGKRILAGRLGATTQHWPEIRALCTDPALLSIARKYLGCEPVLLGSRVWWNFPSQADAAEQMTLGQGFHYDLDGYKALAVFFYLTDVTLESGPHICVVGSHKNKPLRSLLSPYKGQTEADIERWYGRERQITVCGRAGSGFAEDIFCFHKGMHPEKENRLILQVRYGIRDYGKAPD